MAIFLATFLVLLVFSINSAVVRAAITKCEKSVTTTSGTIKAANEKKICSGDLIFEESFDAGSLDFSIWEHDITFTGDSVWVFLLLLLFSMLVCSASLWILQRIVTYGFSLFFSAFVAHGNERWE